MRFILLLSLWALVGSQIFLFFKDQKNFFKFPFLLVITFSVFILPTLTYNITSYTVFPDQEYNLMCLNILLCLVGGFCGYYLFGPKVKESDWELNLDRLYYANLVFIAIGMASGLYLFTLNVDEGWYGLPVYILFLARFIRPAIVIHLTLTILKPSQQKVVILLTSLSFLLYAILLGRRSEFGFVFIYVTTVFHLLKGWDIPRWSLPVGLVSAILILNIIPSIRDDFKEGDYSGFFKVNYQSELTTYLSGQTRNEVIESAYTLAAYERSGEANWGKGIWNQLVNQYVPRGILGAEFKDSMRLPMLDPADIRKHHSAKKKFYFYLSPLGYTSAFMEFRYFSFMFFFAFGAIAKYIYEHATKSKNIFWIMFYTIFSISIPLSNTGYIGELFSLNIVYLFVLFTCAILSAQKKRSRIGYLVVPTALKNALVRAKSQQLNQRNES